MIDIGPSSDLQPIKQVVKPGITRTQKYTRAGTMDSRPVFHVMNIATIGIMMPKWFSKLVNHKKFSKSISEQAFRKLRKDLEVIGLELSSQDIYNIEKGYIVIKSFYDGNPKEAAQQLKADLRMFNRALKEFKNKMKEYIDLLDDYRVLDNGRLFHCPARPRIGRKL